VSNVFRGATHARRRVVTAALFLGVFLAALDVLVVAPAMPSVVASLGGLDSYPWVFSAYLLASTVTTPIGGRLADARGRKRIYLAGLALFLAGSALSGASTSMAFLVAMRAIQGIGAGALLPTTLTLVGDLYRLEERPRIQGLLSGVWGIASIVGPPVGGAIVHHLGWRWIFYLNVPFGLAAAWLIGAHLEDAPREQGARALDPIAALSLIAGLTAALWGLQMLGHGQAWLDAWVLVPAAVSALALGGFAVRERASAEPLVDRALLSDRSFLAASAGGFLGFAALYSASAFVPLYVRGVLGGSAKQAGMALMPMSLAWVVGSNVAGKLLVGRSARATVIPGAALILLGCLGLSLLSESAGQTHLLLSVASLGAGMGLSMTGFLVAVQEAAPAARLGIATSTVQFFRSLGGAVGVSLLGAVFVAGLHTEGIDPLAIRSLGAESDTTSLTPSNGALMAALHSVFLVGLVMAGGGVAAGLSMPRRQRAATSAG
jgi:EmrB/QacA subfamily drug resistance transporter